MIDPRIRQALLHQLTIEDRRQRSNPYALSHYLKALDVAEDWVRAGRPLRAALMSAYCGPIVARLLRAAGLPPLTKEEIREVN